MSASPARRVVVVGCLSAVLAACASAPGPWPPPDPLTAQPADPVQELGWTRVQVEGTVRAIAGLDSGDPPPHLLAVGDDDGTPLLVDVTDGRATPLPPAAEGDSWTPPDEGYQHVDGNGDLVALVGRDDPGALLLHHEWLAYPPERLRDAQGREAAWVSPLLDGEGNLRVVGAVRSGDRWQLHAWQAVGDGEWLALDRGRQLTLLAEPGPSAVLTGTTETTVVVAGEVADVTGRPGVWSLYDTPAESGGRWQQHPTETVPDGVTDVASWDLGWWVAGHVDGRPVVYDFDDPGTGAALPVPGTRLDPDHPLVLVAGVPVGRPMVLATQSEAGPAVWVAEDGGWSRTPAPSGRLSAAQRVGDGVYVVVDGALWFRHLPAAARPTDVETGA